MNPALAVQIQGLGAVNADQLNTFVQTTTLVTDLRNFTGLSNMVVYCQGLNAAGDTYGGLFYWNSTSAAADNSFSVIVPNGALQGGWIRTTEDNFGLNVRSSYANDAAAAAGGVPVGGTYRNGSVQQVRVT